MDALLILLETLFASDALLYGVISSPRSKTADSKITIRPIVLKQQKHYQITTHKGTQTVHQNLLPSACKQFLIDCFENYKNGLLCSQENDFHILINSKLQPKILKKPPTHKPKTVLHNLPKKYLLQEGEPVSYLVQLGIMDQNGKVIAKKRDKFKQLNRFLELISDVLPEFMEEKLHIVDFGCGKAYLTFALYDFLTRIQKRKVVIHGLDLKQDVIAFCQELSKKLGYRDLHFSQGDINHFKPDHAVDMVISLHACDTATDAALDQAVKWKAKVILCVPCCQHELYNQVKSDVLNPILRHGILRERFAALATDAARAQALEIVGYHTQVLEFIDLEHTPKNLLIRAVKHTAKNSKALELEYKAFKQALHITPSVDILFP